MADPRVRALTGRHLPQPDRRSCGAASLVVARLLLDPSYDVAREADFRREVLATHRDVTGVVSGGRLQLPWPRALGTPPWAVAHRLGALTGVRYRSRVTRLSASGGFDAVAAVVAPDSPVGLYVGSRWLPRHVVLAVAVEGDVLRCYEPSAGRVVEVARAAFAERRLGLAGWSHPWFSVLPAARRTPA